MRSMVMSSDSLRPVQQMCGVVSQRFDVIQSESCQNTYIRELEGEGDKPYMW